ncbi:MAG: orotidine-5'-phosphate decarboxylase [Promethearchaeota archaeon CR_4]|nr:MAG: orotidine-5'-phosphate decarboxylase [Candidatus Lokiarchaeota archaeon CR_4]
MRRFSDTLIDHIIAKKSFTCVGIDPEVQVGSNTSPIPTYLVEESRGDIGEAIFTFFKDIINEVADIVPIFKLQIAFFEKFDALPVVKRLIKEIHQRKGLAIIDAKRNDISSTSEAYATAIFERLLADATTVNGYLGSDCVLPFLKHEGKGVFVLVKTSNPSSAEFQDLFSMALPSLSPEIGEIEAPRGKLVRNYLQMANLVGIWGAKCIGERKYSDVGSVVGATFPTQMKQVRQVIPQNFFLIPGYGAQGGTAADIVHGVNRDGLGAIVNSSRGIDYAYQKSARKYTPRQYAVAARAAVDAMNADIENALRASNKCPW